MTKRKCGILMEYGISLSSQRDGSVLVILLFLTIYCIYFGYSKFSVHYAELVRAAYVYLLLFLFLVFLYFL